MSLSLSVAGRKVFGLCKGSPSGVALVPDGSGRVFTYPSPLGTNASGLQDLMSVFSALSGEFGEEPAADRGF